jgi:hypothetical protein
MFPLSFLSGDLPALRRSGGDSLFRR